MSLQFSRPSEESFRNMLGEQLQFSQNTTEIILYRIFLSIKKLSVLYTLEILPRNFIFTVNLCFIN